MDTPLIVELIPDPELGGFTARIPDIPAYGEGETEDEAIVDLKEALRAYIEAFGIDDALARANVPLTVRPLDWTLQDLTPPPWLDYLAQAVNKWCASWNCKALRWFGCAGAIM